MTFTPNNGELDCTTSSLGKKNALPFEFLALRSARCVLLNPLF